MFPCAINFEILLHTDMVQI